MTVDATNSHVILKPINSSADYREQDCVQARHLVNRGRTLRDDSEQEISYYQKAMTLCPDYLEAYYYLGAIYIKQQNASQAVRLHREITRMQPDQAEAHFRLGVSYLLARQFRDAEQEFQRALSLDSGLSQAKEYLERLKNQEILQ